MNKRELYKLIEKLESARKALQQHTFDIADRSFVESVIHKDLDEALSTAEYLRSMAD